MKKILWLDPEMPKTHLIPANDPDGKLWKEWERLSLDLQFADYEFPDQVEAARKALEEFANSHTWQKAPLIQEQTLMLGSSSAMRGYGKKRNSLEPNDHVRDDRKQTPSDGGAVVMPGKSLITHPDNLYVFEDQLERFDVRKMKTHAENMKDWGLA